MAYRGYLPRSTSRVSDDVDILGAYDILGEDDDILGEDDDMLGADDVDLLGAIIRRRKKKKARGSGVASNVVRSATPTETRLLSLPIDSTVAIGAGAAANLVLAPVEPFRVEAIMIDPVVAPSFIITGVLVGRKSQLMGGGAIACTLCAPNAPYRVQWDTAQTSQPIQIAVTNTSAGALRLMGQLLGTALTG